MIARGRRVRAAPRPPPPCRSRTRGPGSRLRATARHSSNAARVGLPVRPYSKPACLPTASWANVVARLIGVTTAPVVGSGWLTRVDRPGLEPAPRHGLPLPRTASAGSHPRHAVRAVRSSPSAPGARNAEHVAAAEQADRMTAVEHQQRGGTIELLHEHRPPARRCRSSASPGSSPRAPVGRARSGSRNARSMSESSSSIPLTSFAASGGSLLTDTTTCDTPRSRISVHALRAGSSGRDQHEIRDRAVLRREHVARAIARATDEPEVHHPLVVVDLREVARGRSRGAAPRRARRGRARAPTTSAACTAVPHDPPMSRPSSRVTRRAAANDSASVTITVRSTSAGSNVVGQKSSPTPSTRYGRPVPPEYTEPSGSAPMICTSGFMRFRDARDPGDRAAGADPGDEVRDPARGLPPDLGSGRALVLLGVVRVRVLVGPERVRRLARQPIGDRVVGVGVLGRHRGRAHHHLGAVRAEQARPSRRSSCRTSRRCTGSRAARRRSRGRRRCSPTWVRRSCRRASGVRRARRRRSSRSPAGP